MQRYLIETAGRGSDYSVKPGDDGYWCIADEAEDALTAALARAEKLERMVVWMAEHGAQLELMESGPVISWFGGPSINDQRFADCDGTPASILAAVEKAMWEK